jgi:RNA polymerase sigma-70 factor (TIGR02957 family)
MTNMEVTTGSAVASPIDGEMFETFRPYLFSIAYRILGSASEAEDIVQDAYLRAMGSARTDIASPKAFLSTIVTHLCLDALKSARVTRESYVGPWLPEPVPTQNLLSPAESAEQADDISLAFLVLLERLAPEERVAYVLREAFDETYDQIATILGKSVAATRQLAHRARERVNDGRPRFSVSRTEHESLTSQFLTAAREGDLLTLIAGLMPDVVLLTDGGGKAQAARRPIRGAEAVARGAVGTLAKLAAGTRFTVASINGQPGVLQWDGQNLVSAAVLDLVGDRIQTILVVVNPDKLRYLARYVTPPATETR